MIYFELLWAFLQVGTFSFGGAYGAIPLIRDTVLSHGWLTDEMITRMIAVSESTPGPIMVNMATYIGSTQAGMLGAIIATLGVVLPSFVVILIIVALMKSLIKNKYVQAVLKGIKPCFIGIVLAMGVYMVIINFFTDIGRAALDWRALLITAVLFAASISYQKIRKKEFSPILLIVLSAGMGVAAYAL
ncbi:MAG: chromate transporter [Christensenellaceae bacterium]|jgi:chromate transporter|nr:chromate transporter [Christensenellaceae bacterium]